MDTYALLWTALGGGMILLMLVDVFHTLFYPHGTGPVCRTIMRALWALSRRSRARASTIAAPAALASVMGAWVTLAILGWALVYLPHFPAGFVYNEGVGRQGHFSEAVYFSMVSLSTVGYGELVPADPLLRFVSATQAITGLGLITASVTWILQTYPALGRRRALAQQLTLFREALGRDDLSSLEPSHAAGLVESFARDVASVSIDLTHFNETYYFYEPEERGSLPAIVHYAQQVAADAEGSENAGLRFAGRMLNASLEDLAEVLRGKFGHRGEKSSDVFQSYAAHHQRRQA